MAQSQSEHILHLSRELLDDIELSRLDGERLLLKCSRLARLVGSDEIREWISYEMQGYQDTPLGLKYMTRTGRWIDYENKKGYWGPLAQQGASFKALETKLANLRMPDFAGEMALASTHRVLEAQAAATNQMSVLSGIRSRVFALLHSFISEVYYQREFAAVAETTFERYKKDVDGLIAAHAGDAFDKIPAVVDRLSEGDEEAISQALNTIRRILEAFADSVFPPQRGNDRAGWQYTQA